MANPNEWLFFAYRSPYGNQFLLSTVGRADREPNQKGYLLATGQQVEWRWPFSIGSTRETWTEREERRAREIAIWFQECEFNVPIREKEFLISTVPGQQYQQGVRGVFTSLSVAQLASFHFRLLEERVDLELRQSLVDLQRATNSPNTDLLTPDATIELAHSVELRAGDYVPVTLGPNAPPACLAIRKLEANGEFEGELFSTYETPVGESELCSEEAGKINGVFSRISAVIGHIEVLAR
ncbi:hypothetical protein [Anatilimnocola floriformis]|uniref:hypothetical protein n=1 Tax=Anatilimnocola floriformis TaxID=2948575 RepID=UPI0020C3209D|nr:hypothetical protein [Anatilimnocola floriformis]